MHSFRTILKLTAGAGLAALLLTGCNKPEEPAPLPPVTPVPKKAEQSKQNSSTVVTKVIPAPKATPPPGAPPLKPANDDGSQEESVPQLEKAYLTNSNFTDRVQNIYKLSDVGTPEALATLGRLFHVEKDDELKTEILDSLFDIDGQDERKAALLGAGTMATESKDVRQSAIDGLGNIDGKYAIPILKSLLSDQDEDIRDSARDTIEQLQTQDSLQK